MKPLSLVSSGPSPPLAQGGPQKHRGPLTDLSEFTEFQSLCPDSFPSSPCNHPPSLSSTFIWVQGPRRRPRQSPAQGSSGLCQPSERPADQRQHQEEHLQPLLRTRGSSLSPHPPAQLWHCLFHPFVAYKEVGLLPLQSPWPLDPEPPKTPALPHPPPNLQVLPCQHPRLGPKSLSSRSYGPPEGDSLGNHFHWVSWLGGAPLPSAGF